MKPLATCAAIACFLCPASEQAEAASAPGPDSAFAQALVQSMEKMDSDMMSAPMNGDPDHDMSAMMIPHHQGAIDMAKAFLLRGRDPALRRLAQEIIVTQAQEIDVMKRRLAALENGAASTTPLTAGGKTAPGKISIGDRVYTGDQTSNTISVI